jgi:ABC-2 type transport system permease protein
MRLRIVPVIVKELLANWRDPKNRAVLLISPLIQLLIFAFAATQEVRNVPIAVFDQDHSAISREFIARFEGSPQFSGVVRLDSFSEIAGMIDSRRAPVVVQIGSDFSSNLMAGRPAQVQLVLDGRRSNAAQIIEGYTAEIASRFGAEAATLTGRPPAPSVVKSRVWFNPNRDTLWSSVPGLFAILMTMVAMMGSSLSIARERELGSFEQLLISPLTSGEILAGKALAALAIALVESVPLLLIARFALGVPMAGSIMLLYAAMVVFLLSVIGIGLFISAVCASQQQAIISVFMFLAPAILLSGYATPVSNMPDWLQVLTLANPVRHFVLISKGIFLKDLPVSVVVTHVGMTRDSKSAF